MMLSKKRFHALAKDGTTSLASIHKYVLDSLLSIKQANSKIKTPRIIQNNFPKRKVLYQMVKSKAQTHQTNGKQLSSS